MGSDGIVVVAGVVVVVWFLWWWWWWWCLWCFRSTSAFSPGMGTPCFWCHSALWWNSSPSAPFLWWNSGSCLNWCRRFPRRSPCHRPLPHFRLCVRSVTSVSAESESSNSASSAFAAIWLSFRRLPLKWRLRPTWFWFSSFSSLWGLARAVTTNKPRIINWIFIFVWLSLSSELNWSGETFASCIYIHSTDKNSLNIRRIMLFTSSEKRALLVWRNFFSIRSGFRRLKFDYCW